MEKPSSGETPKICPYPIEAETTVDNAAGRILSKACLIDYLQYVIGQEAIRQATAIHPYKPTLAKACTLLIHLLEGRRDFTDLLTATPISVNNLELISSPSVLSYDNERFLSEELPQDGDIAFWHGGLTGLNWAHFEILFKLSKRAIEKQAVILLGLERTKYLKLKERAFARPWPLIVSISIYAHLAEIYKLPLYIFTMPEIPDGTSQQDLGNLEPHYEEIYNRIARESHQNVFLVISTADRYQDRKKQRMINHGLTPDDFAWVCFSKLVCPSTNQVLRECNQGYIGLMPGINQKATPEKFHYEYLLTLAKATWLQRRYTP